MDFLDSLIADSPLGAELKLHAELYGFHSFRDIIARTSEELLALPGFNKRMLFEYIHYVEQQGYGHLFDPDE